MSGNYPPGVTGNEYEIAGPDYEIESDTFCPALVGPQHEDQCGSATGEQGYGTRAWLICVDGHVTDLPAREYGGPDTPEERAYHEQAERRLYHGG